MKQSLKLKSPTLFIFVFAIMMFCDGFGFSPHGFGYWFEWVYADCAKVMEDGAPSAVYGFPFPYYAWAGDTSGHYLSMPHVFLLNMLLLSSVPYIFIIRIFSTISRFVTSIFKVLNITLITLYCISTVFSLYIGFLSFTLNVAGNYYDDGRDSYFKLRPGTWVSTHSSLKTSCDYTPSVSEPEPQDATKNRFQAP